jgi:starvation-inducible DNA-binding protein
MKKTMGKNGNLKSGKVEKMPQPSAKNGGSKQQRARLHPTRIDLPEKNRDQICEILNDSLAECLDLKTQVKQAHWNVKGVHFYQLHLLFDEMATELEEFTDLFAERVTTLGGTAMGTVRMAAAKTTLPDYPVDILEGMDHVVALADRYAQFGESIRENIDVTDHLEDKDTADIFTEVSREIDKRLWFLEAHLQAESATRETRMAAKPKR